MALMAEKNLVSKIFEVLNESKESPLIVIGSVYIALGNFYKSSLRDNVDLDEIREGIDDDASYLFNVIKKHKEAKE